MYPVFLTVSCQLGQHNIFNSSLHTNMTLLDRDIKLSKNVNVGVILMALLSADDVC